MKYSTKLLVIGIVLSLIVLFLVACTVELGTLAADKDSQTNALGAKPIWSFETEEDITSTPALDEGNKVYVRTSNTLIALDAQNGTIIWDAVSPSNTPLGESPLVLGNAVIVPEKESRIAAFDVETGHLLWRSTPIDPGLTHTSALEIQSITNGSNLIYVARFNSGLTAYRLKDGQIMWEQAYSSRSNPHLASSPKVIYLGMGPTLYAFDSETGNLLWQKELGGYIGPILLVDRVLYILDEEHVRLYAININNQDILWTNSYPKVDNYEFTCLTEINDELLIAAQVLIDVSKSNGQVLWSTNNLGRLECPAIFKNKILIRNIANTLYVIDVNTGKEIGRVKVSRNATTKHQPNRSPVANNEILIVPVSHYKIDAYIP